MKFVQVLKSLFSKGDGGQSSRRNFLRMIPAFVVAPKVVPALLKNIGPDNFVRVGTDEALGKDWTGVSFQQYAVSGSIMTSDSVRKVIGEMVLRGDYEVKPTVLYMNPLAHEYMEEFMANRAKENKNHNRFIAALSPNRWPA